MRLVPYGPMFVDEVIQLLASSPKSFADEFGIQDSVAYSTCTAYASPQPYRVLLDKDVVVGWCRLDYGIDVPGRKGVASIHEFVAKPGYHMQLLLEAEKELLANGYKRYALWVRLEQDGLLKWAEKRRNFQATFYVGLADIVEHEEEEDARRQRWQSGTEGSEGTAEVVHNSGTGV